MLVQNRQFKPIPPLLGALVGGEDVGMSRRFLAAEKRPWAIVRRYFRDPMFSPFGTVTACDGQTDGHTTTAYTALASVAR